MTEYSELTKAQIDMEPQELINYCLEKWRELGEMPIVRVTYKQCSYCGERHKELKPFNLCKLCYGYSHRRDVAMKNFVEKKDVVMDKKVKNFIKMTK